jgi:uncharacterized RDD family membrane protein YckC
VVDSNSDIKKYHIASRGDRLKAYLIDDTIVSLFLFAIFYNQFMQIFETYKDTKDLLPLALFLEQNSLTFILLRVVYQTFFVWQYGATPGKMMTHIKIIELDRLSKPSFKTALLRAIFRVFSDMIFYIGYLVAFFNPLNQTLHDKLAKTIVVDV